jgi:hypothetical protein
MLANYLHYLLARGRTGAAEAAADRLLPKAALEDRGLFLSLCDRLLAVGSAPSALRCWNAIAGRGLILHRPLRPESGQSLTNADFSAAPLDAGFDWRLRPADGVRVLWLGSRQGLRVDFSGRQPESWHAVEQILPLVPSRKYRLRFAYRTKGIPPGSGLRWTLSRLAAPLEWSSASADLSSPDWSEGELRFETQAAAGAAVLALDYERPLGRTRVEGAIEVRHAGLSFDE